MNQPQIAHLRRQIKRFVFAQSDMAQAAAAAHTLASEHLNGDLCRALETAIVVCYARPFAGSNRVGPLGEKWVPADPSSQEIHKVLLALRDQVYAHNDVTDLRGIVDTGEILGTPSRHAEEWIPINRAALPRIIALAAEQQARFRTKAEELEGSLRESPERAPPPR